MKPLAVRYRVIAYSRRYHWPNAAPGQDADATLERQVENLAALMEALEIAPVHVVGHSYGGATALLLARSTCAMRIEGGSQLTADACLTEAENGAPQYSNSCRGRLTDINRTPRRCL